MVSVCLATYNGEKFIQQQVSSILSQLSDDDELIVSDDNSTDRTIDIIKSFSDERIRIYTHDKSRNNRKSYLWRRSASFISAAMNFQNALSYANGDIIFLSDQDDVWYQGRVSKMVDALKNSELAYCNYDLIDAESNVIKHNRYPEKPFSNNILVNIIKMPFFGSAMAFKRSILNRALPLPDNCLAHDNWIALLSTLNKKPIYIPDSLHGYRIHSLNVSNAVFPSKNPVWYRIYYRCVFLFQLIKRQCFT